MADKTYRVGIIGCGGMGRSHAGNWASTGRAEVVTASDISAESAAKFAEEHGLPTHYTDFGEMCEKENLDIVSITTWQSVRAEPTIACRGERCTRRHYRETNGGFGWRCAGHDGCL